MIHTRTVVPLPVSCVDGRLERMNTKTKSLLTSQAHKSIDLKTNTPIPPAKRAFPTDSLLSLLYLFHTNCISLRGDGRDFHCHFISHCPCWQLRCSSSCLLVVIVCLFFFHLFPAQVYIIKHPVDEGKKGLHGRTGVPTFSDWKCMSLNVFLCVLSLKNSTLSLCFTKSSLKVVVTLRSFHSGFAQYVEARSFPPRSPKTAFHSESRWKWLKFF